MRGPAAATTTTTTSTNTTTGVCVAFDVRVRWMLAGAALLVGLAACSDDDGTEPSPFAGPDGDFTIVFPGEPAADEIPVPFPDGTTVTSPVHIHEARDSAYLMSWTDYPEQFDLSDTDAVLESARDGAISNIRGALDRSEEISLSGRPGLDIAGSADADGTAAVYFARVFIDERRLYQAAVVGEARSDIESEALKFLDSFEFTEDRG